MYKALISISEPVVNIDKSTGYRVAQVTPSDETFPVATGLLWVDCEESVTADAYYYDGNNILPKPTTGDSNQPITTGTQSF